MATAKVVPDSTAFTAMRAFWNPMLSGMFVTSRPTEPELVCCDTGVQKPFYSTRVQVKQAVRTGLMGDR